MVYKKYHGSLCTICRSIICIAHVVKLVWRSSAFPFLYQIRGLFRPCENDYAVRRDFPLTAFSTCTPLCRRAKICLYLRHRAFRSEQSRHGWKDYYRSFALTKNSKYVKMRPPGKAGRPSEWNNTANAGRIVRSRNGRKILPAFLLGVNSRHLPPPRYRRKKKVRRNRFGAGQKKEVLQKAVRTVRRKNRQGRGKLPSLYAAVGVRRRSCRAGISPIRCRTDHRTPAEPSAAEFSGLVSATAPWEQGVFAPCGFVLT